MNRRVLVALLAALLVFPAAAEAQLRPIGEPNRWGPRFRITPFIGFMPAFERTEDWVAQDEAEVIRVRTIQEIGSGIAFGLNLELPLAGRFGLFAGGAYTARDRTVFEVGTDAPYQIDGNHVYLARAGIIMHLTEDPSELVLRRANASLFAGGAAMHERPRNVLGTADIIESGTHIGVNLGMSISMPLGSDRFAVQIGAEDNIIWWNPDQLASLANEYFGLPDGATTVTTAASNVFLVRAGLSLRLR
jgi:hypothetical protein